MAYQDELSRQENGVYFAGEHTEAPHGWIDTAIKSGVRAAAEIHLGQDYSRGHPDGDNTAAAAGTGTATTKSGAKVISVEYQQQQGRRPATSHTFLTSFV